VFEVDVTVVEATQASPAMAAAGFGVAALDDRDAIGDGLQSFTSL